MALTDRDRACYGPRNQKALGSVPWCWQTLDLLKIRWQRRDFTEQQFQETLAELSQQEVWNVVPPEQPYGSLDALLRAEIGQGEQAARALLAQATHRGERNDLCESHKLTQKQRAAENGVSPWTQHRLDHLATHRPDLLADVQAASLSIHAAYQKAKGKAPDTPIQKLKRAWDALTTDEKRLFFADVCTNHCDQIMLAEQLAVVTLPG